MNKVNLIYGVGDVLHTHVNINPFAEDADGETIIRADVINLDEYVDDAELTELVAEDVVDYIGSDKAEQTINNWVKKIRIGGKIIIGGVDILEVSKSLSQYRIDVTEANRLIYGEQTRPYLFKKSGFTCVGIAEYLEGVFGLRILKKRINNYKMIVEAQRYENSN
tara:strand:- start:8 stop:502 length:495 start_codon:yes stop_codon:yes gene_type:complete